MVFNSAGIWFCRYSIRFRRYLISQAFNSAGFSMLQVFKSAGIQSCRYLSLKALFLKVFNSAGIRFWRFSCLQVFNSAGIQFCRYSIPQVFDSAGIQICRFSILQVFDPAGIRAWRHQFCRYSFQRSNVCRCTFCQPYLTTDGFHTNSEYIFTVLRITLKKSHLIKWPANSENPYWNFWVNDSFFKRGKRFFGWHENYNTLACYIVCCNTSSLDFKL